jgi:hypothetical protein
LLVSKTLASTSTVWSEPEPLSPYRPASSLIDHFSSVSLHALLDAETTLALVGLLSFSLHSACIQPAHGRPLKRSVWFGAPSASPFSFAYARGLLVSVYVTFQYVLLSNSPSSTLIERSTVRQARSAVIFAPGTASAPYLLSLHTSVTPLAVSTSL